MRLGLFTDGLAHLSRREAFAWCARARHHRRRDGRRHLGAAPAPRPRALLAEPASATRCGASSRARAAALGVNAAGNPLHPDPAARAEAQAALRGAIELAALLGVDRVVTMARLPGRARRGGPIGVFALWSICCDDEPLWAWQLRAEVGPYWRELSDVGRRRRRPTCGSASSCTPGVTSSASTATARCAPYAGPNIGINLDPSHFWWQGVDPVA